MPDIAVTLIGLFGWSTPSKFKVSKLALSDGSLDSFSTETNPSPSIFLKAYSSSSFSNSGLPSAIKPETYLEAIVFASSLNFIPYRFCLTKLEAGIESKLKSFIWPSSISL